MLPSYFNIFGLAINFFGGFNYLLNTLQGKTKPNRVTWFLWGVVPLIAFSAEIQQGVGLQSLLTLSVGLIPVCVFIVSFFSKKSEWKLGKFDFICGAFSILGIILWYITKAGNAAILLSILADFLAAIPTLLKAFYHPETESYLTYFSTVIASIITFLTIKHWNFAQTGYPFYTLIINIVFTMLIKLKVGKHITS